MQTTAMPLHGNGFAGACSGGHLRQETTMKMRIHGSPENRQENADHRKATQRLRHPFLTATTLRDDKKWSVPDAEKDLPAPYWLATEDIEEWVDDLPNARIGIKNAG
jgi:hypothetical protein